MKVSELPEEANARVVGIDVNKKAVRMIPELDLGIRMSHQTRVSCWSLRLHASAILDLKLKVVSHDGSLEIIPNNLEGYIPAFPLPRSSQFRWLCEHLEGAAYRQCGGHLRQEYERFADHD